MEQGESPYNRVAIRGINSLLKLDFKTDEGVYVKRKYNNQFFPMKEVEKIIPAFHITKEKERKKAEWVERNKPKTPFETELELMHSKMYELLISGTTKGVYKLLNEIKIRQKEHACEEALNDYLISRKWKLF